jgi:hypothetical protein
VKLFIFLSSLFTENLTLVSFHLIRVNRVQLKVFNEDGKTNNEKLHEIALPLSFRRGGRGVRCF